MTHAQYVPILPDLSSCPCCLCSDHLPRVKLLLLITVSVSVINIKLLLLLSKHTWVQRRWIQCVGLAVLVNDVVLLYFDCTVLNDL